MRREPVEGMSEHGARRPFYVGIERMNNLTRMDRLCEEPEQQGSVEFVELPPSEFAVRVFHFHDHNTVIKLKNAIRYSATKTRSVLEED